MTKLEQAARQALGALEVATTPLAKDRQEVLCAITTLREALSGVQALSAAPADVEDAIAWLVTWKGGEHTYVHAHASELPAVTQARVMGGTVTPCVAALAASPTPPAEQQAATKAAPGELSADSLRHQNKLLAETLGACILASGIVRKDIDGFTGPELLHFGEDLRSMLEVAPQQEAQEPTEIPEKIERMATDRYKVVPSHESMFHRWAVVAGTGTQQLYLGREVECQNMARKFAGAFLDGAFVALQQAAPKAAPGDAIDEAMRERDDAEDYIDALLDEVLGHERPEWSSSYGRADALNDVQERMMALHKPAVDKAWGQFQSAMAAPQQEAQEPAPPAPAPLTDAQIAEMMRDTWGCASIAPRHALEFARAVERAHGITQKGGGNADT